MAIGAGDALEKTGATQVLQNANGAQISSGAFGSATSANLNAGAEAGAGEDVVYGSIRFTGTFAATPGAASKLSIYAQALNIDGANDANAPAPGFLHVLIGEIPLDSTPAQPTTRGSVSVSLPNHVEGQQYTIWISHDAASNLNTGWGLDFIPKAVGAAA